MSSETTHRSLLPLVSKSDTPGDWGHPSPSFLQKTPGERMKKAESTETGEATTQIPHGFVRTESEDHKMKTREHKNILARNKRRARYHPEKSGHKEVL